MKVKHDLRRITYTIPTSQVDAFVEQVRLQHNLRPDTIINPQPYSERTIFVSYRRVDSEDVTGRIYDYLSDFFGRGSIFKDTENILPGFDFREILEKAVTDCDITLVVIGRNWDKDDNGVRLHDENDFVRFEIQTALQRNIPVIPVLVQGRKTLPKANLLPEAIRNLVYRNAVQIRPDPDFRSDLTNLIGSIERIFQSLDI